MRLTPTTWGNRPCVRVQPTEIDLDLLAGKEPTPGDWLGRLVAKAATDKWECNASNVFNNVEPNYVIFVPKFKGFVPPKGAALETSLWALRKEMVGLLAAEGFEIEEA